MVIESTNKKGAKGLQWNHAHSHVQAHRAEGRGAGGGYCRQSKDVRVISVELGAGGMAQRLEH